MTSAGKATGYREPSPDDLKRPEFEAIWQAIKTWDINVPDRYRGYCGTSGNHVMAILDAMEPHLQAAYERGYADAIEEAFKLAVRTPPSHWDQVANRIHMLKSGKGAG